MACNEKESGKEEHKVSEERRSNGPDHDNGWKKFVEICKEQLIPAIKEKVGAWASKVIVQMDGAGGHKIKTSLKLVVEREGGNNFSIPHVGVTKEEKRKEKQRK